MTASATAGEARTRFVGTQPAFLAHRAAAKGISRSIIDPPEVKQYSGFNRVCRSLRHVATAIYHSMREKMSVNPIEVQASIIDGRLHISSNFHCEHIPMALHHALIGPLPGKASRPQSRKNKQQMTDARAQRHLERLQKDFLSADDRIDKLKEQTLAEISTGIGLPGDNNLARDQIVAQALAALDTLRQALQDAAAVEPRFDLMVVHSPYRDPSLDPVLPPGVTQTMHAEQTIENALAASQQDVYHQAIAKLGLEPGEHVIVPMAGRYVPCAVCHEVESQQRKDGGLFDPANQRFVLHRSSERVGKAYGNEVQYLATRALDDNPQRGIAKGIAIRDRFLDAPEQLQAYGRDVVVCNSFDTDSGED